jgi:hypothetical protein
MKKTLWVQRLSGVATTIKQHAYMPYGTFILGALLGLGFFAIAYDLRLLDPTFTDWLLVGEDLKQHFLGWEFYRHEPWTFPLGAIDQLAYPFGISLTYMDSVPLFAIPAKIFAPVLPENFQYFGAWGLLCYMLQGGIAAMIMRRWTKNPLIILLVAAVFVVSPIMMARMFVHTALAGHWIILLAVWAMIERDKIAAVKKQVIVWSSLFVLAVLVHPYFLPMVALPFAVSLILLHKEWLGSLLKAAVPPLVGLVVFWAIGGFAVGTDDSGGGGLGNYQLNFTSLFNPLDWSAFVPTLHKFTGESLNYLGLGVILLLPVVLFIAAKKYDTVAKLKVLIRKMTLRHLLVVLVFVGLTLAAMSPRVFLGTRLLLEIDLPHKIESLWGVFQASARLFWVIYYLIILGVLVCVIKSFGRKSQVVLVAFLAVFIGIQLVDVQKSHRAEGMRHLFNTYSVSDFTYTSPLKSPRWAVLAKERQHIVYLDAIDNKEFFALADIAAKHKMSMNTGYFARSPHEDILAYQNEQIGKLLDDTADLETNLYITKRKELVATLKKHGYVSEKLNGFYVVR